MSDQQQGPYRSVVNHGDSFAVLDADGHIVGSFSNRGDADRKAEADRRARRAGKGQGAGDLGSAGPAPDLGSPSASPPAPSFTPGVNAMMASSFKAAHPDAFSVFDLGGKGQGYGVLDQAGGAASKFFDTKGAAQAFADSLRAQFQASVPTGFGAGSGSAGPASSFAGWARPSTAKVSTAPSSSFAGRPGIDLDDGASASMAKVATTSSTVADSFAQLAKAAEALKQPLADAAKFMNSGSTGPGKGMGGGASPFASASGGFQANVKAMAAAFKAALQNPAGGVPLGGRAAGFAAQAGGMARGFAGGVASFQRRAKRRVGVASRMARRAASRVKFNPSAPIRSSFARARAGAGGFASGFGGRGGAAAFKATSISMQAAIEATKALYDLARIGLNAAGQMRAFAESVNEGNKGLSKHNVGIAVGFRQAELANYHRDIGFAKNVEETTKTLARAVSGMRDSWAGWDSFVQNAQNRIGIAFAAGANEAGKSMSFLGGMANQAMKDLDPTGAKLATVVASVVATFNQAAKEAVNAALAMNFGNNPLPLAGAVDRMDAAQQKAMIAALKLVDKQNDWGVAAGTQLNAFVARGPIRGPRRMP